MKKKLICCLVVLAMCLSIFAGCATVFGDDDLVTAIKNLETSVRPVAANATQAYDVPNELGEDFYVTDYKGNPATIYVQWKIEGSRLVDLIDNGATTTVFFTSGQVIDYTLKATLVNERGKAYLDANKETYTISIACSTGGTTQGGGNTGGNTGDNTGGNTGGNTGDNTGGSTGGNTGDNTGGSGNTGGNTGGSSDELGTLVAELSLLGTATRTTFDDTYIVHSANGVTYTYDKANASSANYDNDGHADWGTRAYADGIITISYSSAIKAIVIECDSGTYNNKTYYSGMNGMTVSGATITVSGATTTVVMNTVSTTFTTTALLSQMRILSIKIYV